MEQDEDELPGLYSKAEGNLTVKGHLLNQRVMNERGTERGIQVIDISWSQGNKIS